MQICQFRVQITDKLKILPFLNFSMGIVSKFIFLVKNFFNHKIHKVKVKFKTKRQRSIPLRCIFMKSNYRNEIL